MAALNFPSSPTVGQQYFAPNGAIYAWDGEVWGGSAAPSTTAAGGDLTGTYPDPLIGAAKVTRAKTATDLWLSPIPVGGDIGKYLSVTAGPVLAWTTVGAGGPPSGPANGDVTGTYPDSLIVSKVNGALLGTTTPLARGDLLIANATPALARVAKGTTGQVLSATATDAVWQALAQSQFPVAPSGLLTTNINDSAITNVKIADVAWTKVTGAPTILQFSSNVTPTGTRPGTSFTVPQLSGANPTAILAVLNGLVLDQVAGAPATADEFRLVGTTLTTNLSVAAADKFKVYLWY